MEKGYLMKGKLLNCSSMSGFGYVVVDGGKHAYFVSAKDADGSLVDGDRVSFDLEHHKRGPIAVYLHIDH